jgi:hypothetical protein
VSESEEFAEFVNAQLLEAEAAAIDDDLARRLVAAIVRSAWAADRATEILERYGEVGRRWLQELLGDQLDHNLTQLAAHIKELGS